MVNIVRQSLKPPHASEKHLKLWLARVRLSVAIGSFLLSDTKASLKHL